MGHKTYQRVTQAEFDRAIESFTRLGDTAIRLSHKVLVLGLRQTDVLEELRRAANPDQIITKQMLSYWVGTVYGRVDELMKTQGPVGRDGATQASPGIHSHTT